MAELWERNAIKIRKDVYKVEGARALEIFLDSIPEEWSIQNVLTVSSHMERKDSMWSGVQFEEDTSHVFMVFLRPID